MFWRRLVLIEIHFRVLIVIPIIVNVFHSILICCFALLWTASSSLLVKNGFPSGNIQNVLQPFVVSPPKGIGYGLITYVYHGIVTAIYQFKDLKEEK